MKKYILILSIIFCIALNVYSKPMDYTSVRIVSTADTAKEFDFTDDQIKYHGNILGKFTFSEIKSQVKGNKETQLLKVVIYGLNGNKVADYDLTILENPRKGGISVVDVYLKTLKDNVKHDGANFINYSRSISGVNELDKKVNILQLESLVEYLVRYKYF